MQATPAQVAAFPQAGGSGLRRPRPPAPASAASPRSCGHQGGAFRPRTAADRPQAARHGQPFAAQRSPRATDLKSSIGPILRSRRLPPPSTSKPARAGAPITGCSLESNEPPQPGSCWPLAVCVKLPPAPGGVKRCWCAQADECFRCEAQAGRDLRDRRDPPRLSTQCADLSEVIPAVLEPGGWPLEAPPPRPSPCAAADNTRWLSADQGQE